MRRKEIPDDLVRSVRCLYEEAKTRVRRDYELSEEFEVKVEMCQGSMLVPFLFTVVVDAVAELPRVDTLSELMYPNYLLLISETVDRLRNKFRKSKLLSDHL